MGVKGNIAWRYSKGYKILKTYNIWRCNANRVGCAKRRNIEQHIHGRFMDDGVVGGRLGRTRRWRQTSGEQMTSRDRDRREWGHNT